MALLSRFPGVQVGGFLRADLFRNKRSKRNQLGASLLCGVTVWVATNHFLQGDLAVRDVTEIILVNHTYREQGFDAMFAAGIFSSQEFVFANRREQCSIVFEAAPHLRG